MCASAASNVQRKAESLRAGRRSPKHVNTLPVGWESHKDSTTGHLYYYNTTTNVTTWERPGGVSPADDDGVGAGEGSGAGSAGGGGSRRVTREVLQELKRDLKTVRERIKTEREQLIQRQHSADLTRADLTRNIADTDTAIGEANVNVGDCKDKVLALNALGWDLFHTCQTYEPMFSHGPTTDRTRSVYVGEREKERERDRERERERERERGEKCSVRCALCVYSNPAQI